MTSYSPPSSPLTDLEDLPFSSPPTSPSPSPSDSPLREPPDLDDAPPSTQYIQKQIKQLLKSGSPAVYVHRLTQTYDQLVQSKSTSSPTKRRADADQAARLSKRLSQKHLVIKTSDEVDVFYLLRNKLRQVSKDNQAARVRRGRKGKKRSGAKRSSRTSDYGEDEPDEDRIEKARPFASTTRYHRKIAKTIHDYAEEHPAARTLNFNHRHSTTYEQDAQDSDKDYSVRYFGLWQSIGHEGEGKDTFIAPDGQGKKKRGTAERDVISVLLQFTLFWRIVSSMLKILQPQAAKYYKTAFDRERETSPFALACQSGLNKVKATAELMYCTVALLINARVSPHRDRRDSPHGFAAMTVFGDFTGGDLYLPRQKVRIDYNVGDVILFKSNLLEHAVLPFTGHRYALVAFTHHHMLIDSPSGQTHNFLEDSSNWIPDRRGEGIAKDAKTTPTKPARCAQVPVSVASVDLSTVPETAEAALEDLDREKFEEFR